MKKALLLLVTIAMFMTCLPLAGAEGTGYPYDGTNEPIRILRVAETRAVDAGYSGWGSTPFFETWVEKSGINAEVIEVADDAGIMLTLSAGDYPDVILIYESTYNGGLNALIEENLAINLSEYSDYMPDYEAILDSHPSYRPYVTYQGGVRFFANLISPDNIVTRWRGMVVRQDMLDKLDMEVPTTTDEFYDLLYAMKNDLGVENPLMGNMWRDVLFYEGFAATEFGIPTAGSYQIDGEYHYGAYEEGYRGLVSYYHKLYADGLLDPNFKTTDESTSQASLLNGTTGVHPTTGARINTISARSEDPDFKLVGIGSLNGSDGTRAMFSQLDPLTPKRINAYVTADSKQPELAVAFFNWLYTDEGTIIANFGPEGLCFNYDEEGNPVPTEYMLNNPDGMSYDNLLYALSMANGPVYVIRALSMYRFGKPEQRAAMEAWDQNDAALYKLPPYSINDKALADEDAALWTDLNTYIKESMVQFVTGELNTEEDFDAYIAQLKSMGMDRLIEIEQIALDEYYSK